ncbi:MAG: hypothetical protein ABI878_04445 [Acidobacteriota bacterium]
MKLLKRSVNGRNRTPMARVLAGALLVGIVYAVTFGSAHSHVNASTSLDARRVATSTSQADLAFTAPVSTNLHKYECLVCLFHQQLFSSTVSEPVFISKPAVPILPAPSEAVFPYSDPVASTPIARLSGRAPPVA